MPTALDGGILREINLKPVGGSRRFLSPWNGSRPARTGFAASGVLLPTLRGRCCSTLSGIKEQAGVRLPRLRSVSVTDQQLESSKLICNQIVESLSTYLMEMAQ